MATENNNGEGDGYVTEEEFVPLKEMVAQIHSAMGLTKQQKVPKIIEKDGIKYQMVEDDPEDEEVNKSQEDNSSEVNQLKAEFDNLQKKFSQATLRKSGLPDQINKQDDSNIKGQAQNRQPQGGLIKMANGTMVSENAFAKSYEPLTNEDKFHAFMNIDRARRNKSSRNGGIAVM